MQSFQVTQQDLGKMVISHLGDYIGHICAIDTHKNILKTQYSFCGLTKISEKEQWIDASRIKDCVKNVFRLHPNEDCY